MGSIILIDSINIISAWQNLPVLLAETTFLQNLGTNVWLGLQVALGLGFVIFVHELGHFLAAKTFGVRCDKFYVGFDPPISIGPIRLPRTLGKFTWGETEYGIGIIPLGGYVKMLGQDDDPRQAEIEAEKIRLGSGEDAPLDPRSFPAKPVWQRMIIISAGVVMNLIFAVILAGVAYRLGVSYAPSVAGNSYGGGPGWAAGIEPGDQVVRMGAMKEDYPEMRYDDFRNTIVMHGFSKKDEPLPLTLVRGSERVETTVHPTGIYNSQGFYLIGVTAAATNDVASPSYAKYSYLEDKAPDIQAGDLVTAVNGEALPVDKRFGQVLSLELTRRLQAVWEKPAKITLSRPASEKGQPAQTLEIELPAVPVKTLGLGFEVGPVTQVKIGSLGEKSGLKVGDVIRSVNGQPVVNGLELPSMVARLAGEVVTLEVTRKNKSGAGEEQATEKLSLSLQNAAQPSFDPISPFAGSLTLGGVGVAFDVTATVQHVDAAGSADPDAKSVQVGDELVQVQWMPSEASKPELEKLYGPEIFKALTIDSRINIASFYDTLQMLPVDAEFKCIVRRNGVMSDPIVLTSHYAENWFWHVRGIAFKPLSQIHQVADFVSAVKIGAWETSRRFGEVLNFLKLLVTGRIGTKGLAGPILIARAAASEADAGTSRLMLFLTMLSANLAILNFLPIPALDGGHMMFLTAEAIRGKPVPESLQIRLTMFGVVGLLSLMAFVIAKDIMWFF